MRSVIKRKSVEVIAVAFAVTFTQAGVLPEAGFPQSCGVQLKPHNFTVEVLDKVHAMGFRAVRRGFYWTSVEKQKGTYDFSDYDVQMARAKELGLTVIGALFSVHKAYEDDDQGGIQTEAGRQGFAAFAAALAERYKDQNVIWEVWNEPNVRTFWRKDGMHNSDEFAEEYTSLVKAVVPAMLKADPNCFVVAGSVSNYWKPSYEWTESCFKKGILQTGIRGWSVHPYGVKTPEEFVVGHDITRALLRQYGAPDLPMINTERGFAVKESAEGWSGGSIDQAREFQSWNFVRQFMIDQLCGLPLTSWYEWDGDKFGIADDGGQRPIYAAAQTMFAELDGYHIVRRLPADSDLDYVVLIENSSGTRKLVAWTAPPAGGSPDKARPHAVAIHQGRPLTAVDLKGKPLEVDLSTGVVLLQLSGAPQYVAIPSGLELTRCVAAGGGSAAEKPADPVIESPQEVARPAEAVDLKLFDGQVTWTFTKNTGEGDFTLAKAEDGSAIGIVTYDFTKSKSKSTPYVLVSVPVDIAAGPEALRIQARSPIAQKLTFRLNDSTGQTLQYKGRVKGTGGWETITIPLTRKLEHWGGANDGKTHFPVKSFTLSIPLPGETHKAGKVEFADAIVH